MKTIKLGLALVMAAMLSACAGVNFVKPADDKLVFGVTTKPQVLALMGGEPIGKGQKVANGENLESIAYAYASVGSEAAFQGVTPARSITYLFHNNVLVGKEFTSSFKADSTYFDPQKAKSVKQGMTAAEVIALLGQPSGEYRWPAVANRNGKGMVYLFVMTKGFSHQQTVLLVEVDDKGVVQKSEFNQVGQL